LWWLAPTIFSVLGGAVAYYKLRKSDPATANFLLSLGLICFILEVGLGFIGFGVFLVIVAFVFFFRRRLLVRTGTVKA
jgi:hypothetical protein